MKLGLFADAHLISPQDPSHERHRRRSHMVPGWRSFRRLLQQLAVESVDLIIGLGDLVDWYSHENVDFALDLLSETRIPWVMVPGNHDLHRPSSTGDPEETSAACREEWHRRGVQLDNRAIEADGLRLILLDSARSDVPADTRAWLQNLNLNKETDLLFTHVPLDHPAVREYIHTIQPGKDLTKYVQSGAPDLYRHLQGRIRAVYSGHLHFPGELTLANLMLHMLSTSFIAVGREYPAMGMALVVDTADGTSRVLRAPHEQ